MHMIEAVLTYRPCGTGTREPVTIVRTADPRVLRTLRDRLLEEANQEAETWREVDPGVAYLEQTEAQRLAKILEHFLPDEELEPDLRLVSPQQEKSPAGGRG